MTTKQIILHKGEKFSEEMAGAVSGKSTGRFAKDVVHVGKWFHPVTGKEVVFTPDRLARLVEATTRYAAAGNKIPFRDGHKNSVLANMGDWPGPFIEHKGALVAVVEPKLPAALDGIRSGSIDGVSVVIEFDHTDSKKNHYDEVITAIDATDFPVITEQKEFIALSKDAEGNEVYLPESLKLDTADDDMVSEELAGGGNPNHDEKGRFASGPGGPGSYRKMTQAESVASAKKATNSPMTSEDHKALAGWYAEHGHHDEANSHMKASSGMAPQPSATGYLSHSRPSREGDAFHKGASVTSPQITVAELNEATDAKAAGKTLTPRQKFVIGEHDALQPKKHRYDREIPVGEVLLKLAATLIPDDDQVALELAKASGKVDKNGKFVGGFDGCVIHMQGQGYSTESSKKICGKIAVNEGK